VPALSSPLVFLFLFLPSGLAAAGPSAAAAVQREVREKMRQMAEAWNRGDLEGFFEHYWNSPELTFYSNDRVLHGRAQLVAAMRERYRGGMGRIEFGDPHFEVALPDLAVIHGEWRVALPDGGERRGLGTAVLRKLDGRWRVVHDHTSSGAPTAGPREAVAAMVERGWNRGELDVFATTMADSVLFHYAGRPRTLTREEMGATVQRWREAFPDLRMEIHEMVAEGDLLAARMTLSGTHQGPWAGAAPTGRRGSMALMMLFRFEGGKLVELWESDDQLGLRRQLGLLP
jgi:uncharacterized protein (TIGR02246 family)